MTERTNAGFFATLATFPDHPRDLEADLTAFAFRLNSNCVCSRDGKFLRRLIQNEGERYPELFAGWREDGPGKTWAALAARFARLAHAGYLDIDDPDLAARQFLALVNADLHVTSMLGETPDEAAAAAFGGECGAHVPARLSSQARAGGRRPSRDKSAADA